MCTKENTSERYLFACKQCYFLDPRVIVELTPHARKGPYDCCGGREYVFLHESVSLSYNDETFHEYQVIRTRKSTGRGNLYCNRREHCDKGDDCTFVHTYQELIIWKEESRYQSRQSIASGNPVSDKGRIFHCPFCALNFDNNRGYVMHLNNKFHKKMRKYFESREDPSWKYKTWQLDGLKKCTSMLNKSEEQCECELAHSEKEYQEWKTRAAVYSARYDFVKEEQSYLTKIQERISKGGVIEMKPSYNKHIDRNNKDAEWDCTFQLPEQLKNKLQHVYILGDHFMMKEKGDEKYTQQLDISNNVASQLHLKVKFFNRMVYDEYHGKLFMDFGEDKLLPFVNFRVTVSNGMTPSPYRDSFLSRIIISYPSLTSHEIQYEENLKSQLINYPLPKRSNLERVYIQNLTAGTYVEHMHNFLYQEEVARNAVLSKLSLECEVTFSQHAIIPGGPILGDKRNGSLYGVFESPVSLSIDSDEGFLARDSCYFVVIGMKDQSLAYECIIESWSDRNVYIHVSPRCVRDLKIKPGVSTTLLIQYKLDRIKFCRMHHALDCLEERVKLICPSSNTYADLKEYDSALANLDQSQNTVLKQILGTKLEDCKNPHKNSYPPLLVAGPFGTGKTHTIRNVIQQIFLTSENASRILLCTHSNSAADLYIQEMKRNNWNSAEFKILRIMYHNRKPSTVLDQDVLAFCLCTEDGKFRYPTMQEILKYRLIITTFSTAPALGQLGIGLRSSVFTHIFLDEASQAMEPEVIMPLTLASATNTRVIIAGDHKQINEKTFLPKDVSIATFLERMYHAYGDFPDLQPCKILLCNNYRCVDGLLQLISELFYKKGILKYSGNVKTIPGYHPVHFTHVEGICKSTDDGDYINILEAKRVVEQVKALIWTVSETDILVTSPYFSQVKLMRDLLRKERLFSVIVYRAASVQALQYKVVILSSVMRTMNCLKSDGENFGFLSDENLLNTVFTRAKSLVIVIGDAATLCAVGKCSRKWKIYLQHCEKYGSIQPQTMTLTKIESQILRPEAANFEPNQDGHHLHTEEYALNHVSNGIEDAAASNSPRSMILWKNSTPEDADEDLILYDMLEKMNGNDDFKRKPVPKELCNGQKRYDPNEPDLYSNTFADREPLTPKHSLGELEHMLAREPEKYKRCKINFRTYCLADAFPIDETGAEISEGSITLDGKYKMGRTFNQDEVLVEIEKEYKVMDERTHKSYTKKEGRVVGIFKRFMDVETEYFFCRPYEANVLLMVSIAGPCSFFTIKKPKGHFEKNPNKIPVYKVKKKNQHFTELELVSCDKVDWDCFYAVKYLKWSEYCQSPLGYVERIFHSNELGVDEQLKLSLGISNAEKPSITQQVKNIKIPEAESGEDIVPIFTIDPEGARDLDDGLSLSPCLEHKNCHMLGIHITNVACFVRKGSPIDIQAEKQSFSFYGLTSLQHMLPPDLSTGKCSLLENEVRKAISTFFHSSKPPPHIGRRIRHVLPRESLVISQKQLTYSEAEDILKTNYRNLDQNSIEFQLKKIWEILWNWRVQRMRGGAFYHEYGSYSELMNEGRSHILVEEAMLAVNSNAAAYLIEKKFDIEVKVQPIPHRDKWSDWRERNSTAIQNSPYLWSTDEFIIEQSKSERKFTRVPESMRDSTGPEPESLQNFSNNRFAPLAPKDESDDEPPDIQQNAVKIFSSVWNDVCRHTENGDYDMALMLLSLDYLHPSQVTALNELHFINEKARWTTHKAGTLHSSLRLFLYTRCSSPIRRYPDIVIQRYIISALEGNAPPQKTERANKDVDERLNKLKRRLDIERYASTLKEQPISEVVSLSAVSEAGLQIFFSPSQESLPYSMRNLDYAHMMLDMKTKDFIEDKTNLRLNQNGDIIFEKIDAVWKFRFYDYQKEISEISTQRLIDGVDISKTMKICNEQWKKIVRVISNPPGSDATKNEKKKYDKTVKHAIQGLTPEEEELSIHDIRCGGTRNDPKMIYHHREIKKTLKSGSVIKIQLSSWCGRSRTQEPCIQLLSLTRDFSVCVHHNKQAMLTFAEDAEKLITTAKSESLLHYQSKFEPLIRLDAAYNAVNDGSSIMMNGIKISWMTEEEHEFILDTKFCEDRYIDLHPYDLLCMRLPGVPTTATSTEVNNCKTYTAVLHGCVTAVDKKEKSPTFTVRFILFTRHIPNARVVLNADKLWMVEILKMSFMHRHLQSSLVALTRTTNILITKIMLRREIEDNHCELPRIADSLIASRKLDGFQYPLNGRQQNQKNRCLRQKFTLVQGPPGTGKSYMGAQIAACFCEINRARNPENPKKVLYCGPSNKAVDVAAGFLKNARDVTVVRMYSKSLEEKVYPNPIKPPPLNQSPGEELKKPDENLEEIALHEIIRNNESEWMFAINRFDGRVRDKREKFTREEVDEYQKNVSAAKVQVLKDADIIICTCSLSARLKELKDLKDTLEFAQCIIDECGMCSEPETLIPIVASSPQQVVLIGDHKQLQPVIKCRKAEKLGLGTSLFSQYSDQAEMLTIQYRMNHEIMEIPSERFYDGKLEADVSIDSREPVMFFPQIGSNNIFWHIEGIEKEQKFRSIRGGRKSKYNENEVDRVEVLLNYLFRECGLQAEDIMVLSPYTAQCTRIKHRLMKKSSFKNVHVGSVVTSQGSEAKFVVLSTVRSMNETAIQDDPSEMWQRDHLGFVTDLHQVNVALTRAQLGLCIIGNKNLLKSCKLWNDIIKSYEERDAVCTWENISGPWHFGDSIPSDDESSFNSQDQNAYSDFSESMSEDEDNSSDDEVDNSSDDIDGFFSFCDSDEGDI